VLTGNGTEFTGLAFTAAMAELKLTHLRIPARSPHHNGLWRFPGSRLVAFYRPHFHRVRVNSLADLDAAAQAWVADYSRRRCNPRRLHKRPHPRREDCAPSRPGKPVYLHAPGDHPSPRRVLPEVQSRTRVGTEGESLFRVPEAGIRLHRPTVQRKAESGGANDPSAPV